MLGVTFWPGEDGDFEAFTNMTEKFNARLAGTGASSNTSYTHAVLNGSRLQREWRDTLNSQFAVISNRGPKQLGLYEYAGSAPDYVSAKTAPRQSLSLEIHGGRRQWMGNVCFNDNSVRLLSTFIPEGINVVVGDVIMPDNLFRADVDVALGTVSENGPGHHMVAPGSHDIFLLMYDTLQASNQHDPLTAKKLVNMLINSGVEVHQAKTQFIADGRVYGPGSFVVPMAR